MYFNFSFKLSALIISCATVLTSLIGCTTTKPDSDNTPPIISKWTLYDYTSTQTQTFSATDGKATVVPGQRYRLACIATDVEGVHSLSVGAGGTFTVEYEQDGSLIQKSNTYVSFYPYESVSDIPDNNNQVKTELLYVKDFVIEKKYSYDLKVIPFEATAVNFSSQKGKGNLTLEIK